MVDRTRGSQPQTQTGSPALGRLMHDNIGKHLRSVYEIDQDIPERIFKLLQLLEEKTCSPSGSSVDPTLRDPTVD